MANNTRSTVLKTQQDVVSRQIEFFQKQLKMQQQAFHGLDERLDQMFEFFHSIL